MVHVLIFSLPPPPSITKNFRPTLKVAANLRKVKVASRYRVASHAGVFRGARFSSLPCGETPAWEARYRAFNSSCHLFIRIVLNFNFELKVLTDLNKRSEMLISVNVYSVMIFRVASSYL